MERVNFSFNVESFNAIFPFYVLIDENLIIKSFGKSLSKILPDLTENALFTDCFFIKRPFFAHLNVDNFDGVIHQLVVIESINNSAIVLKGQFELHNGCFLFVGSPWFSSVEEVTQKGLTLNDFAFHDPLMDLLHVLKTQEITNNELKEFLKTINNQRVQLRKDKEELSKFSLAVNTSKDGLVFTASDGKIIWSNQGYLDLTGYSYEEVIGKTLPEIGWADATNKETLQKMISLFNKGKAFDFEIEYKKKNGRCFWSKIKGQRVLDANENLIHYFVRIEDITKEKDFNNTIKESESRLSSLIVNLETGILLEDQNRKILLVNTKFCKMFGIEALPEMMIGTDCSNSAEGTKHYFKSADNFVARIDEILEKRETVLSELIELVDGTIFERTYTPIFSDGNYKGHLWSYNDVTINFKYKESLQTEKEKYQRIIANMNIGLLEVDNDDIIVLANETFSKMSGYSTRDLIGKKGAAIFLEEEEKKVLETESKKRKSKISGSYELKIKNKNGEYKDWLISGGPNFNFNGEVIGSIGLHFDMTERNTLQAQREQLLKKLENQNNQLNDYAHIVSHDLKSPMRSIHALISWIKEDNSAVFNEQTGGYFSLIQDKVEKMDSLIDGILTFAKVDDEALVNEQIDFNSIVNSVLGNIFIPSNITVVIKNTLPVLLCNRFRMIQVFQNLITNAILHNDKEQGFVEVSCKEYKKHYVFSVSDNGPGIAKENHGKIFKTFESLDQNSKNNGLGLSIVKRIIKHKNEKIWLESNLNEGAKFFFTIKKH